MFNFFKKRLRLILIIFVLVIIGIFFYQKIIASRNNEKVESAKVKRGTLKEELTISGTVNAEEKVTLRFKTSGRLAWVGVREGDYVTKYQGIASLDKTELKKQLQKELNDYMNERWDFDQTTKDDYKDRVMTDTIKRILGKAQFDLDNIVLDVEIQNLAVEYANLWTPIEGIVTKVAISYAGVNITPAQAEFEIINPNTIYFSALADQTEVTKLSQGLLGELVLDAYTDETFTGSIKNISFTPKTGETGTVYEVKFQFQADNSDYRYRLGMAGDLSFVTKSKDNILYLPIKFVKEEDGKKYVEIKEKEKPKKAYVETGMETDDEIEIIGGIKEGEVVYN